MATEDFGAPSPRTNPCPPLVVCQDWNRDSLGHHPRVHMHFIKRLLFQENEKNNLNKLCSNEHNLQPYNFFKKIVYERKALDQ
jgi:hypothetical protein